MIVDLARAELRILRRDRSAWWALLALAAFILLAFAGTTLDAARGNADKAAIAAAERARWLGQGDKDPHSAAHYSIFAFKPAPPLVGLDSGATPFVGQAIWLEAHHQNDLLHRPQQGASLLQRAGLTSPAALILGIGPLVVFLLAFALVAQDRERRTMRLALGLAKHPRLIVGGKALAIWIAATGLLVVPVSIASATTLVLSGAFSPDAGARLALWAALMATYLALPAAIGVLVSLRARSARIALAILFGSWILFGLVLPRLASTTVDDVRPLPSSQAVHQQMLEEAPAYWTAEQSERHKRQLLAKFGVARIEDIPNARMAEMDLVERHSHDVFDRILGGFYGRVAAQDRLFATFGLLSPTIAGQAISASLAGTDFSHQRDFIDTAERYRRDLVNRMNAEGMAHSAGGAERYTADVRLWGDIPEFAYSQPPLGTGMRDILMAILALGLWIGVAWWLLRMAARRITP